MSLGISTESFPYTPLPSMEEVTYMKFEAIPLVAFRNILSYCSIEDEISLFNTSKAVRVIVQKSSEQIDLFNVIKAIRKMAPKVDLNRRWQDTASYWLRNIEYVPVIGAPIALVHCISGLSTTVLYKLNEEIHLRRGARTKSDLTRELSFYKYRISGEKSKRSLREMMLGALFIIPGPGLLYDECVPTERNLSPLRLHAIYCLRGALMQMNWFMLIKKTLINTIPRNNKNILIIIKLSRRIALITSVTINGKNLEEMLNHVSDPKILPWADLHHEIHVKCNIINQFALNMQKAIAKYYL